MIGQNIESNSQCRKQTFTLKSGINDIRLVVCRANGEPVATPQSDVEINGVDIVDEVNDDSINKNGVIDIDA